PYIWAAIGLLFMGAEFFLPGFVIFFFGLGSLVTALLSWLLPGLKSHITLQILLWLASSGLSLYFLRRYFSKIFRGNILPNEESEYAGKTAVVLEAITPENPGRVRFQGTSWQAISYDESFAPGDTVEILKEENLTFVVTGSIMGNLFDKPTNDSEV
ncbi:MAG TPA: NfeD family protein, partial [Spirochaetia bacterium]|nr:NfeD family protein [Spirochaetia bacterium]